MKNRLKRFKPKFSEDEVVRFMMMYHLFGPTIISKPNYQMAKDYLKKNKKLVRNYSKAEKKAISK